MSGAKRSISVIRTYTPEPDDCTRALELLLKRPVRNEGSPSLATLNDTRGESENDSRTKPILPR
jgi:hypothetical protein